MDSPKLIALLVGLVAATALPAMAMLSVEQQSESIIDLGTLQDMNCFFKLMGFDANTIWEAIGEPETHDWAAIEAEDAARAAATSSDVPTPENIGLATRQDEETCSDETDFGRILCDNMPTRDAWWAAGGSLPLWYYPERLNNFIGTITHTIVTAQSIRQIAYGPDLGKTGSAKQYKFSVPATQSTTSNDHGGETSLANDYIYEEETGIVHYQGTRAALVVEPQEAPRSALRGAPRRQGPTSKYSIVIQATALSNASTIATEDCVTSMIKWHVDEASTSNRFKCVPLDNRGSWRFALHVNINHGPHNDGTYGKCCD